MAIGWFDDLPDAENYYTVERFVTADWDNISTNVLKTKCIINAYNRIYYDDMYNVPTYAAASPAQLIILKKANGEMAYYLAQQLADEDHRKGIQAQGVIKAGIVKEDYFAEWLDKLPVPPFVDKLLKPFKASDYFSMDSIDRDEDYDVDEDVTGL